VLRQIRLKYPHAPQPPTGNVGRVPRSVRQEVYLKVCLRSCVSKCVARSGDMSQEVSLTTPVRRVSKEVEEIVTSRKCQLIFLLLYEEYSCVYVAHSAAVCCHRQQKAAAFPSLQAFGSFKSILITIFSLSRVDNLQDILVKLDGPTPSPAYH